MLTWAIDIKPNNVLFEDGTSAEEIQEYLDSTPPNVVGEFTLHGKRYQIMLSEPMAHPHKWNDPDSLTGLYSVCLTDLGHGMSPAHTCYLL
jgi:hypothetical protein